MKIVCMDGALLNPGDVSWQALAKLGDLQVYPATAKAEFAERAKDADVILVNKTPIFKNEIGSMQKCSLVGELATGTNNLDLAALKQAGIKACNVPSYGPDDIAQHAFALLFELARNVSGHSQSARSGEWQKRGEWSYWLDAPLSLAGLTLGIIGFGNIGRVTGKIGHACGMKVLALKSSHPHTADYPFENVDLEEIWRASDVISLHCPLVPETAKIINEKTIAAMKPGVIILNTARGGLVDEEAVAHALETGKLGGFGADVLSSEPPAPDNPLLFSPRTLITPHMAWGTARARQNIINIMAENISAFFSGKPQNLVN